MSAPLLAIEGLSVGLGGPGGQTLLDRIGLTVAPGETRGLIGESGAGKSTIGKAILRILPPGIAIAGGTIRFEGEDLLAMPAKRFAARLGTEIALIPQDPMTALNPARRIFDQLTDGLRLKRGLRGSALRDAAVRLLTDVQIADPARVLSSYPHELSGGMRQRILIAGAFSLDPKLIIADEPTTALDVRVQKEVLRLIRALQRRRGTGVVFITHDIGVVAQVCDTLSVLYRGRVVEEGPTAEVLRAPAHAYTRALIAASPNHERPELGLAPIPASVLAALDAGARTNAEARR